MASRIHAGQAAGEAADGRKHARSSRAKPAGRPAASRTGAASRIDEDVRAASIDHAMALVRSEYEAAADAPLQAAKRAGRSKTKARKLFFPGLLRKALTGPRAVSPVRRRHYHQLALRDRLAIAGQAIADAARSPRDLLVLPAGKIGRLLVGSAVLAFIAGAAHAALPQYTTRAASSSAAILADDAAIDAALARYDCDLATRVALQDALPVYVARCDTVPSRIGSPFTGASRELFAQALASLEGEYRRDSWQNLSGINLPGLHKVITSGFRDGGTAPFQSVAETYFGNSSPSFGGKLDALVQGAALYGRMSDSAIDAFASMAETCIGKGVPMAYGAANEVCAILVAGEADGTLTPRTACLLASAYRRPLQVTSSTAGAANIAEATTRFNSRRRVAAVCLERLHETGAIDANELRHEKAALQAMTVPMIHAIGAGSANPLAWLSNTLPGGGALVLRDALAMDERRPLRVSATFSAAGQQRLARLFNESLTTTVAHELAPDVCIRGCAHAVDYLLAIARRNPEGSLDLLGAVSSDPGMMWGPVQSGVLQPMTRSAGSLTKIAVTGCLMRFAPPRAGERFCRNRRFGINDPEGRAATDCSRSEHFSDPQTIIGRSENSSFAEWVSRAPVGNVQTCAVGLGADLHGDMDLAALASNSALGTRVVFSPAELMRAMSAEAFGPSSLPVAYKEQPAGPLIDLRSGLSSGQTDLLDTILRAPIDHPLGTMRASGLDAMLPRCRIVGAKSGTSDSGAGERAVRDKMALIALDCDGQQLIAFVMVGAPDQQHHLGPLHTSTLARILAGALPAINSATPSQIQDLP